MMPYWLCVAERLAERNIPSFARIGLDIKSGAITVHGSVASKAERLLLIHILRDTPGVQTVKDGLVVATNSSPLARRVCLRRARTVPRWGELLGSMPSMPSVPSFSSLTEGLSSVKPLHAGILLAGLGTLGFFFSSRVVRHAPVAVYPGERASAFGGKTASAEATVVLHPVGKSETSGRSFAPWNGRSRWRLCGQARLTRPDGSPEGDFVATVHLMKAVLMDGDMVPGPDLSPDVYRSPETSPLRVKITRETKEISLLELHNADTTSTLNN